MKGGKGRLAIVKNAAWGLCALLFLSLVWVVVYFCIGNSLVLPSPWETVGQAFLLLGKGSFWKAFFATFLRSLIAFLTSGVLAAAFAILSYLYPLFAKFFKGLCAILRTLPTMAVLLIILLLFRDRRVAPIAVGVLTLFPLLYTGYYNGLQGVGKELVEMSDLFQVPLKRRLTKLYFPALKSSFLCESAAGLSFSLKLIVSAEILVQTADSLGWQMQDAGMYAPLVLFALTLLVCLCGMLIEGLASFFAEEQA